MVARKAVDLKLSELDSEDLQCQKDWIERIAREKKNGPRNGFALYRRLVVTEAVIYRNM